MHIQWFPGHMTKSLRMMEESVKVVDAIGYVLDCRAPFSCFNPAFGQYTEKKPCVFLLNKSDLADEKTTDRWLAYFASKGDKAIALNANEKGCAKQVVKAFDSLEMKNVLRLRQKGVVRPVRIMIIGVPNSGKSSIINLLSGRKSAVTGNKPGVTRGKQWIRLGDGLELLDTPGILWPKFEDQQVGLRLALIGSIKDEILNIDELAIELIRFLKEQYAGILKERYDVDESAKDPEILCQIAENRKCISKGGELDYSKAATLLIDEFRSGCLGRITLERP